MRRLILLAIGLSALLWAASARTGAVQQDDVNAMSGAGACLLASDSQGPSDTDQQWRAQHYTIAAVTESTWKSALVHAELAGTRSAPDFETVPTPSSPDPPLRSTPHYLRHTPLLI